MLMSTITLVQIVRNTRVAKYAMSSLCHVSTECTFNAMLLATARISRIKNLFNLIDASRKLKWRGEVKADPHGLQPSAICTCYAVCELSKCEQYTADLFTCVVNPLLRDFSTVIHRDIAKISKIQVSPILPMLLYDLLAILIMLRSCLTIFPGFYSRLHINLRSR